MTKNKMLSIDGVFLAVRCEHCGTIYPAKDGDYLAFYGSVTAGLSSVIVGVDPPRKPAKKAVQVVCRTPSCVTSLVKKMMGCEEDESEAGGARWEQILRNWAGSIGHNLIEEGAEATPRLGPKAKLHAKKRAF